MKLLWLLWPLDRDDTRRLLGQILGMLIALGIGWSVEYLRSTRPLSRQNTQFRQQLTQANALLDSITYQGRLASQGQLLRQKDEQILRLQENAKRDSLRHLSDLDAIRAINDYIEGADTRAGYPSPIRPRQREPGEPPGPP